MTIYGHIRLKLIFQHAFNLIWVYGNLQGKKLVKKCQKYRFWSLNPNYPIWCLNIMPRHLQWLSMVTYHSNWCQHAFWSALRFMVMSCATIGQKYAKNVNFAPPGSRISNVVPQYCNRRFFITIYGHIWFKFICQRMVDLFRGWWWSSGEKIDKKYAKNAYIVTPWIPNIQYHATILCQDILIYYLWLYSDHDWYVCMRFDPFQGLCRSQGPKICYKQAKPMSNFYKS